MKFSKIITWTSVLFFYIWNLLKSLYLINLLFFFKEIKENWMFIEWTVDKFHFTHCRALDSKLRQGHSFFPAEEGPGDGGSSRGHALVPPRTHQTEHGPGAVWGGGGQTSPRGNTLPSLGISEFSVHHYTSSCQSIIQNKIIIFSYNILPIEMFGFLFAKAVFCMSIFLLILLIYFGVTFDTYKFQISKSRNHKKIIFCNYSESENDSIAY